MKTRAVIGLTLVLLVLWWRSARHSATPNLSTGAETARRSPQSAPTGLGQTGAEPPAAKSNANGGHLADAKNAKAELQSLSTMAQTLSDYANSQGRLSDLVAALEQSRQEPFITHDANEYTGEMAIVRTKNPLPGTRYFHAQYFTDEDNKPFVQHMSFEFKPGPTALNDAIAAVRRSFPQLGEPKSRTESFAQWDLDDHRIVWVKKMGAEDLKDDPFNAYTAADTGTVRVAVEAEIHDHDESHEDAHL